MLFLVQKHIKYDKNDSRLPDVVCSSCKRNLYLIESEPTKKIEIPDFSQFLEKPEKKVTRICSKNICNCKLCVLSRKTQTDCNFSKGNALPPRNSILVNITNTNLTGKLLLISRNLFTTLKICQGKFALNPNYIEFYFQRKRKNVIVKVPAHRRLKLVVVIVLL